MRVNRQIRAPRVRVIDKDGSQLGVLPITEALMRAENAGLDLIEISAGSDPPVCKIIDYGKYRYQMTKKEKESKKSQHQVKVKEIKMKPQTDEHDLQVKTRHAREFITKGNKVRLTCVFRGREMQHPEFGERVIKKMIDDLSDIAIPESNAKLLGRSLSVVLAPGVVKKKAAPQSKEGATEEKKINAQNEI
ncbi:MAG TPA: translation initiation factor IF-3 [Rhabdochlamydiaceae bacterium]|nr:translation initiation factor IF-3 [Rhabdochlamydiaceae bacterium]